MAIRVCPKQTSNSQRKMESSSYQSLIFKDVNEFKNYSQRPSDELLDSAIRKALYTFELPNKVKVIHLNDIFQKDLAIWSEPPGLPWKHIGYKTKGDIKRDPNAIQLVRRFWYFFKNGRNVLFPCCTPFVRRSCASDNETHAERVLWAYPATVTFGEAMFALPLIKAYEELPVLTRPIAYGSETFAGKMQYTTNRFRGGRSYIGIDFKKFDKTVPAWLIEIAFDILALNINFCIYQDHGVPIARRIYIMFTAIANYFINTKIQMANGHRYEKHSGIANGSYFNQLVRSIVNCILINWMHLSQTGHYPKDSIYMKDSSLMVTDYEFSLEDGAKQMKSIGMEINMDKSQIEPSLNNIKFFGYDTGNGSPSKGQSD